MIALNKVMLMGYLGADPDTRYTRTGTAVTNFSLATTENWKDKQGEKQSRTEWHRIVVWGKLAELCQEYLTKGSPVYVEGRIQTNEWQDKEGNDKQIKEIIANKVLHLRTGQQTDSEPPNQDDDIPF
ncbi:MAG: single-stranded DNA-binding protein [Deltaproteobacteria bacterium]|jgi:single-strand DNA-binding protein|nr:single-stranded DNA-binding protein [Deltaproteobacteria bacterium]